MSGGPKFFTATFRLEVRREEEAPDGKLINPIGMPMYTLRVVNLPADKLPEVYDLFLRQVQSQEGRAQAEDILRNVGTASDIDDLLLRDIERIERSR